MAKAIDVANTPIAAAGVPGITQVGVGNTQVSGSGIFIGTDQAFKADRGGTGGNGGHRADKAGGNCGELVAIGAERNMGLDACLS